VSCLVNFNVYDILSALVQFVLTSAVLSMAWWGNSLIPNRAKLFGIKYSNLKNIHKQLIGLLALSGKCQSQFDLNCLEICQQSS
jgi:hypothetical protein